MTDFVYKLPDPKDTIAGLCMSTNCGQCRHVCDVPDTEWYRLGDFSSDARCALLSRAVSSHVGTCTAFSLPLTGHARRLWRRIKWRVIDAYWWVAHRVIPRRRYHVMKTGLKPGYYDPCDRILAGIFMEVHRFVCNNMWDWTHTEQGRMAWRVFIEADKVGTEYMIRTADSSLTDEYMIVARRHVKKVIDNLESMWH